MDNLSRERYINEMKPLHHPAVTDITVEGILYALSDSVRARILIGLISANCAKTCTQLSNIDNKNIAKSTLSQHFKVLREAGLIRSERVGNELHNTVRCEELRSRFGDMVGSILDNYRRQMPT
jgi:DNA-binding transcriptional ArsR family regulator